MDSSVWDRRTLLLGLGALGVGADERQRSPAPAPSWVVLLRHGEKAAEGGDDPGLSEQGRARANELARMLAAAGPALLFASEYRRTRETLLPLATALGQAVESLPAREPARWIAALDALQPGQLAVLCGHSNTVPDWIARLQPGPRSEPAEPWPEWSHDRLVVLVRPFGAALELRYGPKSREPGKDPSGPR